MDINFLRNIDFNGDSPVLQIIGKYGYRLYDDADLILMYIHLLASSLFPIYIGSHASLRCPPGDVCKDAKKAGFAAKGPGVESDDEDDELDAETAVEGLTPSDAIMFPVLAGFTLAGLYFLIKWLDDPNLLNRILGWYFSSIGVIGVGKLAADALNVITTFVFPTVWASGDNVYLVDSLLRQQVIAADTPFKAIRGGPIHRKFADKSTPLPGFLSQLKFPEHLSKIIWAIRDLFSEKWIFRAYVHGLASVKSRVRLNDAIGFSMGLLAITVYNLNGKAWWLTNLMGFGFCYGTLQLMSPTTFWTGSLVLMGLFVYDVIMVFYTPMMVSVATTLDVPIKLVFPGPKRGGMLGLGDVVLPGIMIALALRFDLYMFYLKKKRAMDKTASTKPAGHAPGSVKIAFDFKNNKDVKEVEKPIYYSATGLQGERYWTSPSIFALMPYPLSLFSPAKAKTVPESVLGGYFPKTYFYASIAGYIVGMLTTLFVLNAYNHAQPALLYLVPGVLGSLWLTSLVRGEYREMWNYTEDGGLFGDDTPKDGDKREEVKKTDEELAVEKAEKEKKEIQEKEAAKKKEEEHAHHVFMVSLSKPKTTKAAEIFESQ